MPSAARAGRPDEHAHAPPSDRGRAGGLADGLGARHGVRVRVEAVDLAVPHAAADLAARLDRAGVVVDVLVNNAGVLAQGPFDRCDLWV